MHFYVGDLPQAHRFYGEALGMGITNSGYPGALFVSAGGYHHHVGLNTGARGATLAEPTDARLLSWELLLDDEAEVRAATRRLVDAGFAGLEDPWRNRLVLRHDLRS